jgi:hypothetical protein
MLKNQWEKNKKGHELLIVTECLMNNKKSKMKIFCDNKNIIIDGASINCELKKNKILVIYSVLSMVGFTLFIGHDGP